MFHIYFIHETEIINCSKMAKLMLLFHVFSLLLCLRRFYRKLPKSNCGGSLFKVHRCTHVTRVPLNKIIYIIASDSYPKSHCILGLY